MNSFWIVLIVLGTTMVGIFMYLFWPRGKSMDKDGGDTTHPGGPKPKKSREEK
jgi:hypothetical protein